jgi:hypothetical protein
MEFRWRRGSYARTEHPGGKLNRAELAGNSFGVTYSQPAGVTGVTYGAEWSSDLVTWTPISDTGTGGTHTFFVNTSGLTSAFLRHKIVIVE